MISLLFWLPKRGIGYLGNIMDVNLEKSFPKTIIDGMTLENIFERCVKLPMVPLSSLIW